MYKCQISKAIWSDDQKNEIYEVLVKEFFLPFPPFLGLDVRYGSFYTGNITSITWDVDKEIFGLGTKDEFPWKDDDGHLHTAEEIKKYYVQRVKWEIQL